MVQCSARGSLPDFLDRPLTFAPSAASGGPEAARGLPAAGGAGRGRRSTGDCMKTIHVRGFPSLDNYGTAMMGLITLHRLAEALGGEVRFIVNLQVGGATDGDSCRRRG
jgi:hypothetical protein